MQASEKYAGQLAPHWHGQGDEQPVFRKKRARMFRSDFVEAFSKVHPIVPALLFVPALTWFAYRGALGQGVVPWLTCFAGGLLAWTFAEYALHRAVFHVKLRGPVSKFLYFYSHGIHHQYPDDYNRLVMVPVVSVPLAF